MTKSFPVTGHCLVKNEDRFVWYAINSVLPYLDRLIVFDTGSTDQTVEIIKSIKSSKIHFEIKSAATPEELVKLREEQLRLTRTPWFFLLDGDEVWPKAMLTTLFTRSFDLSKNKLAVVCRTRNAVGDIYHYLPESFGHYHLLGQTGHFNIRLYRNVPGLSVKGVYPLESYMLNGHPVNEMEENLAFADVWYLHLTHLDRSSRPLFGNQIFHRKKKFQYNLGIKMLPEEIPEIFFFKGHRDNTLAVKKRSFLYVQIAVFVSVLRWFSHLVR